MATDSKITNALTGYEFRSPAEARATLEQLKDAHTNKKVTRRLEAIIDRWETHLGQSHVERLKDRSETITGIRDSTKADMDDSQRRAVQIARELETGRLDYSTGLRQLAQLRAKHQETLRILDSLARSSEAWEEDADRPIDDLAAEMQQRFPAAGVGGLTVTLAMLEGEAD